MPQADPNAQPHEETCRAALLTAALPLVAIRGWNNAVLKEAAQNAKISEAEYQNVYKNGFIDVMCYFFKTGDQKMIEQLAESTKKSTAIHHRIEQAVIIRLEIDNKYRAATRQAIIHLARPQNQLHAFKIVWKTADQIWQSLNDQSTDYNYYTKRSILSGVLMATRLAWLDDTSDDLKPTRDFLARRIEDVLRFEKTKARILKATKKYPDLVGMLARLRYPR